MVNTQIARLRVWQLAIPLRGRVAHAGGQRAVAEPIVAAAELGSGTVGWGETLPRPYVTGEDNTGALDTIRRVLAPVVMAIKPEGLTHAFEQIDALPRSVGGACILAARSAVELALIDAYSRHFGRPLTADAGWFGRPGWGTPGSLRTVRYTGVLASSDPARIARHLRLMRLAGLRHFKLKVAMPCDSESRQLIARRLGNALRAGRATLRLDANGGWSYEQAREQIVRWRDLPIVCVEQPLAKDDDEKLAELHRQTGVPLMADESLITHLDAEWLLQVGGVDWFNVRLGKNGGWLESLGLIGKLQAAGKQVVVGCLVGETSILSAAARRAMQVATEIRFAEGSFGRLLLAEDVCRRPVRFGVAGRGRPLRGLGWGIDVDPARVSALAAGPPQEIVL